jgi:hypothetical protein
MALRQRWRRPVQHVEYSPHFVRHARIARRYASHAAPDVLPRAIVTEPLHDR